MEQKIRDGIIAANSAEYILTVFCGQVLFCSVVLGFKFHSWLLFGFLFLFPLLILLFYGKFKWCKMVANVLCVCYILVWGLCGAIIGSLFEVAAAIVLGVIFLLIGAVCNIAVIRYFREG